MRATTLLSTILGMKHTRSKAVAFDEEGVVVDVEPTTTIPRCSGCGCRVDKGYDERERRWRHLDLAGMRLLLRYKLRRVKCPRCGVVVEIVPWAEPGSWFTRDFEEHTAYLAQTTDKTTVVSMMRVAWRTVGTIVHRVVRQVRPADLLDNLKHIGIDELSYRKRHEYITVVIDHDDQARRVGATGQGCGDARRVLQGARPGALREAGGGDARHVGRLRQGGDRRRPTGEDDLRPVPRRASGARGGRRGPARRGARAQGHRRGQGLQAPALHPAQEPLEPDAESKHQRLSALQQVNGPIYRAYLLKESLCAVLDNIDPDLARIKLTEWIGWAQRSRLEPFTKLAGTIKEHFEGILAYIPLRLNNGRTEGNNRKIRTITSRAYGFHDAWNLIALIRLCCSGISLLPVLKFPPAKMAVTSTS